MSVEKRKIVRLYRDCSDRDKNTSYILTSKDTVQKGIEESIGEFISHELNALTGRGVYFSFSTKLDKVVNYAERNPQNSEICYVDIDLDDIDESVIAIHPIFDRDYIMNLICSSSNILENECVLNPATKRKHSLLGIINLSQRTVASWANSMNEVMIQCNCLELKKISTIDSKISSDQTEKLLRDYCFKELEQRNIECFIRIINESFKKADLKRRFLIDRIATDKWYKSKTA